QAALPWSGTARLAGRQDAGPAQGAPVQVAGDWRPGRGEDQYHQALRAPELLLALPGHNRRGLRAQGQERFGNMTRVYYREAMGAFIVFDVTRPATFEAVAKWKNDLDSKLSLPNGKPVSVVLLANKCDQGKDVLMNNGLKMDQFCKEHGFVGWFETSAKENINIDEASRCLVKHILANECDLMESIEPDVVKPHLTSTKVASCSGCAKS
ncbi:RAB38 isoform 3, partial [Pan troglodytes]